MSAQAFVPPSTLECETMFVPVTAGTTLHVVAGRLQVEEPARWLGERVVTMPRLLRLGEVHVVLRGGLLRLEPQGRVVLQWRVAPARPALLQRLRAASWPQALRRLLGALRPGVPAPR